MVEEEGKGSGWPQSTQMPLASGRLSVPGGAYWLPEAPQLWGGCEGLWLELTGLSHELDYFQLKERRPVLESVLGELGLAGVLASVWLAGKIQANR
jgi:hypothetical protein